MQAKAKITCYQELYAKLKESDLLSDFGWPAQKEHLDFYFNIGNTKIFFRIFSDKDMMQIRSETIRADVKNDDNIALVQEVNKNFYGIFGTSYDGKIVFNLSVPFPSVSDDAAKQLIVDKTNYFINMITTQLESEYVANIKEKCLAVEETDKSKKKKIGFFLKKNSDIGDSVQKETAIESTSIPKTVIPEKEEFVYGLLEDTSEQKIFQQENAEMNREGIPENILVEGKSMEEEPQNMSEGHDKVFEGLKAGQNAVASEMKEAPIEEGSVSETDTIDKQEEETETKSLRKLEFAIEKTKLTSNKSEQDSTASHSFLEEAGSALQNPQKFEESNVSAPIEKAISVHQEENGISEKERQHMSELYESINRTFNMRKDQLDYREKLLTEQKKLLKCEKDSLQKERESIKLQRLEIKEKEDSLKKNWEQYKKVKKRQEQTFEKMDEREKKVGVLETDLTERLKKADEQEHSLSTREQEVAKKLEEVEASWKEYREKSTTMKDYEERLKETRQELAENELKLDMQRKQNAMERQAIEEKIADLKEMEEMIEQIKKDSGIGSFAVDTEEFNQLKDNLEQMKHQTELMQEELINKTIETNQALEQMKHKNEEYEQIKQSYEELKALNLKNVRQEKHTEQVGILKKHIEDLEAKNQDMETKYRKKVLAVQDQYDTLLREHGVLKEKLESLTGPDIVSELTKGGYTVLNGEKNNQKLLTFSLGGCKVWIDDQYHLVEIEKETKRNYAKQMQELNERAHDRSFCSGKGKVYCRFVYHDIVKEIRENIAIMVKFK